MDPAYNPAAIERHWYEHWERQGHFEPHGDGEPWCILLPPPNVTGSLHMGHGFQQTLMDVLVRWQRMRGRRTLWQGGTDHAGIATQMVVERQLERAGESRAELGRDAFVERVWRWKEESGGTITRQMRRLGVSLDWSRERFTMDEGLSRTVREVFVRLHREGLIYRGQRLVNWDPQLRTAVSDLEVVAEEEQGHLWHCRYPLVDGDGAVVVATTRPETLLGDTAVAVHPEDERYRALVGRRVRLPLAGRELPIIADDQVDSEFGTGCVKITPAHDFNDYEMGLRHQLPMIDILAEDATLNDNAPAAYRGLDRYEARRRVVAALAAEGLLEKVEPHRLKVPRGDRSGVVVEPRLTDQWFVRAGPLAEEAQRAVEDGRVRFVPDHWKNSYFAWLREIKDWCISRQLWWGHRIPAWYGPDGQLWVGHSEEAVRREHQLPASLPLRQDEDVLDTWFSSALWSFSTLGWPERTPELADYHPTAVLVTGFDIIFFWVARMVMMSLHLLGEVPFHDVYVTGLVRDARGQKMSKSRGNALDPIDLVDGIGREELVAKRTADLMKPKQIEQIAEATRREFPEGIAAHGTDALRFTFCALASTTRDLRFDMGRVEGYRNFCNKLWNAARFVMQQATTGTALAEPGGEASTVGMAERWIVSRLQRAVADYTSALDDYRFDLASQALHEFCWHEYCDWYLELAKLRLADLPPDSDAAREIRRVLVQVLEQALRLAHPMMPFITEELWQRLRPLSGCVGDSLSLEVAPVVDDALRDTEAEAEIEWLKGVVGAVRHLRGELRVPPGRRVSLLLRGGSADDRVRSGRYAAELGSLAGLADCRWLEQGEVPPPVAAHLRASLELLLPLAGLADPAQERQRLQQTLERLEQDALRHRAKLERGSFASKAPVEVVDETRRRLAQAEAEAELLRRQLILLAGAS